MKGKILTYSEVFTPLSRELTMHKKTGFTLIELSIVLVIIGLISGGVLVGRELIKTAELRKAITQIESVNTSVNTFRLKYNCLPGDCGRARDFGLSPLANLDIYHDQQTYSPDYPLEIADDSRLTYLEGYTFFGHLLQAGFPVSGTENDQANRTYILTIPFNAAGYADCGKGYFYPQWIEGAANKIITQMGHYMFTRSNYFFDRCGANITPEEAFFIDSKIDDTMPRSGIVVASGSDLPADATGGGVDIFDPAAQAANPPGADQDFCITNQLTYNVPNTSRRGALLGLGSLCMMAVKMQF